MSRTTAEAKAADNTVSSSVCSSIYMTLINLGCHERAAEVFIISLFLYFFFLLLLFVYILQSISGYNMCNCVHSKLTTYQTAVYL